jgi:hypothetical protein
MGISIPFNNIGAYIPELTIVDKREVLNLNQIFFIERRTNAKKNNDELNSNA